jgi:hypothetical protein
MLYRRFRGLIIYDHVQSALNECIALIWSDTVNSAKSVVSL